MTAANTDDLYERGVTIAMMVLTYTGLYIEDPDEASAVMAEDETFAAMATSDVQLGVVLACSWIAAAAQLDGNDVRTIAQSVIDGMLTQ